MWFCGNFQQLVKGFKRFYLFQRAQNDVPGEWVKVVMADLLGLPHDLEMRVIRPEQVRSQS